MIFDLPTTVDFGGRTWDINTDYRDVLEVLAAFEDAELSEKEKAFICLYDIYPDFDKIPQDQIQAAFDAAIAFIDRGNTDDNKSPRTMDWTQDAPIIFPAINHVAGFEVRAVEYLHWWTFMGYFMEIKDSTAATVLSLRQKKAKGKKLEKWEREYWQSNKKLCELSRKLTAEEQREKDELKKLLGG